MQAVEDARIQKFHVMQMCPAEPPSLLRTAPFSCISRTRLHLPLQHLGCSLSGMKPATIRFFGRSGCLDDILIRIALYFRDCVPRCQAGSLDASRLRQLRHPMQCRPTSRSQRRILWALKPSTIPHMPVSSLCPLLNPRLRLVFSSQLLLTATQHYLHPRP
jgi:hypothetical protein